MCKAMFGENNYSNFLVTATLFNNELYEIIKYKKLRVLFKRIAKSLKTSMIKYNPKSPDTDTFNYGGTNKNDDLRRIIFRAGGENTCVKHMPLMFEAQI